MKEVGERDERGRREGEDRDASGTLREMKGGGRREGPAMATDHARRRFASAGALASMSPCLPKRAEEARRRGEEEKRRRGGEEKRRRGEEEEERRRGGGERVGERERV
eukprot:3344666-Rhodomonas_salina.2